jgi:hypothetical protein
VVAAGTEGQQVVDAAVVEHKGRGDRAAIAAMCSNEERKHVVCTGLGEGKHLGVEAAVMQENIVGDDQRIHVHAELREISEVAAFPDNGDCRIPNCGRVVGLADRQVEEAEVAGGASTMLAAVGQHDKPVPIGIMNHPGIK